MVRTPRRIEARLGLPLHLVAGGLRPRKCTNSDTQKINRQAWRHMHSSRRIGGCRRTVKHTYHTRVRVSSASILNMMFVFQPKVCRNEGTWSTATPGTHAKDSTHQERGRETESLSLEFYACTPALRVKTHTRRILPEVCWDCVRYMAHTAENEELFEPAPQNPHVFQQKRGQEEGACDPTEAI